MTTQLDEERVQYDTDKGCYNAQVSQRARVTVPEL
jgi:hypothetical protein